MYAPVLKTNRPYDTEKKVSFENERDKKDMFHVGKSECLMSGFYEDSVKGRVCEITNINDEGIYTVKERGTKCGELKYTNDNNVELEASWGKDDSLRKWSGRVMKGGIMIAWKGVRGLSSWNRVEE